MGIIINKQRCCGCQGFDEPKCVQACPGDLCALDPVINKSYIREQRDCWDCMCCVKACPTMAIEIKLPYQIADYKASIKPTRMNDSIKWTLIDVKGNKEEFVIKTRVEPISFAI